MKKKFYRYTNGKDNVTVYEGETPPEGYYRGYSRRKMTEEEKAKSVAKRKQTCLEKYGTETYNAPQKMVQSKTKGYYTKNGTKHWYTNGITNGIFVEGEEPEGYYRGQTGRNSPQMKWYTNGTESKIFTNTMIVPEGWVEGRYIGKLPEEKKQHALEKRYETNLKKYGYKNPFDNAELIQQCIKHPKGKDSIPNKKFKQLLELNNLTFEQEFPIKSKRYDFKVNNILIEINPTITHNSTWCPFGNSNGLLKSYHYEKTLLAEQNGYRCVSIFDWDNVEKVIQTLIKRPVLYARNCEVKELIKDITKEYLTQHHLQGYVKDVVRYGLYNNNELVSVMTFGKPRYNKNYEWELLRYCSHYYVPGGSEKLFKTFLKQYNPSSVISYCDKSKFNGKMYTNLGFTKKSSNYSKHWYNISNKIHITDNLLRQRGFDQLFHANYGKGTSNEELMLSHGFVEIYDCGQDTFVYNT